MTIIYYPTISLAVIEEDGITTDDKEIILRDSTGRLIDGKIHYNGAIIDVLGRRKLPELFWQNARLPLSLSIAEKRFTVGYAQKVSDGLKIEQYSPHDVLLAYGQAIEKVLTSTNQYEERIQTLEKAYNGSDITELE